MIVGTFAIAILLQAHASAEESAGADRMQDASVRINEAEIPFSSFASPEAQRTLAKLLKAPPAPDFANTPSP